MEAAVVVAENVGKEEHGTVVAVMRDDHRRGFGR